MKLVEGHGRCKGGVADLLDPGSDFEKVRIVGITIVADLLHPFVEGFRGLRISDFGEAGDGRMIKADPASLALGLIGI